MGDVFHLDAPEFLVIAVFLAVLLLPARAFSSRRSASLRRLQDEKIEKKEDARYDAMTDEQREAYYVNPGLWTKVRKSLRGR